MTTGTGRGETELERAEREARVAEADLERRREEAAEWQDAADQAASCVAYTRRELERATAEAAKRRRELEEVRGRASERAERDAEQTQHGAKERAARHTSGPWEIEWMEASGAVIITARHSHTVATMLRNVYVGDAVREANARLIAAAPDLLAACVALVAERADAIDLARAAVERATT